VATGFGNLLDQKPLEFDFNLRKNAHNPCIIRNHTMPAATTDVLNQSELCYSDALACMPGGVNSPVRAFKAVGGHPIFVDHGKGAHIYDVDGKAYIDYVGAYGPLLLGHAHPAVVQAITEAVQKGTGFGAPTVAETALCNTLCSLMPMDQVRLVNSGTEATMSAIRLARGVTGRAKIIKFVGCYHGHHDSLLVEAGSGALTLNQPSSAGVPESLVADTLIADYNDLDAVQALFDEHSKDIAAIILEPIAGNMNLVPGNASFIKGLRELCDTHNSLLIFDEVMTGFRVGLGGATAHYGIEPDIICLGKIIGGGLPVGAFGAKNDFMQHMAPEGPVYQAGTCSGNPLAVAAGLANMAVLQQPGFYETLGTRTQALMHGLQSIADDAGIAMRTQAIGGMFGFAFIDSHAPWQSLKDVQQSNTLRFNDFFRGAIEAGIYLAPSAYEAGFVSAAHTDSDIAQTLSAAEKVIHNLT
jgi:glutamate-1-semialdehyde 2,1-aminomutase